MIIAGGGGKGKNKVVCWKRIRSKGVGFDVGGHGMAVFLLSVRCKKEPRGCCKREKSKKQKRENYWDFGLDTQGLVELFVGTKKVNFKKIETLTSEKNETVVCCKKTTRNERRRNNKSKNKSIETKK